MVNRVSMLKLCIPIYISSLPFSGPRHRVGDRSVIRKVDPSVALLCSGIINHLNAGRSERTRREGVRTKQRALIVDR